MMKKKKIILMIDDDRDDQELFGFALHDLRLDVDLHSAFNGEEGLKLLDGGLVPDLIFLDLNMPRMNGKECLIAIRERPPVISRIPVIIYSTSSSTKDMNESFAAGANMYIVKSTDFETIGESIRTVLNAAWEAESDVESFSV